MSTLAEELSSIEEWDQTLSRIAEEASSLPAPTYVICGPKKSGKSTFACTLCNTLLQKHPAVALLETDCGQPQHGPAGLVSITVLRTPLLLPARLTMQQPDESILIGDTSPQNNPLTYLNAIRNLHQLHVSRTKQGEAPVPLVVNTMGWVKGFGLSLLRDVVVGVRPTHVVALQSGNPVRDLPPGTSWIGEDVAALSYHCLPGIAMGASQPTVAAAAVLQPQAHSATEERSARLHAWALATLQMRARPRPAGAAMLERAYSGRLALTAAQLCACRPVAVDLAAVHTVPMFEGWGAAPAAAVLSGALVGLLRCDPSQPRQALLDALVDDPPLTCGLGLVHAVDPEAGVGGLAYIHTPAPLDRLQEVGALCVCMLDVAKGILGADGHTSPYLSLHCLTSDSSGGSAMRSRRNLVRAGQL